MKFTEPKVHLIAQPQIDISEVRDYLSSVNGMSHHERRFADDAYDYDDIDRVPNDGELIVEFAGRLCYRSWEPGLNPNVSKIREDLDVYLQNVLASGHGSVLEHAFYVFVFQDVTRVFTHELVRHRAGVSISQESLRFVRLDDLPFWMPEWAREDHELFNQSMKLLGEMEAFQYWMAEHFDLGKRRPCTTCTDHVRADPEASERIVCPTCKNTRLMAMPFSEKKAKTSFMRRFAPIGLSTSMVWGANVRALRHVIEMRTAAGAEEEIRLVFGNVARLMKTEVPYLFGDYEENEDGSFVSRWRKV